MSARERTFSNARLTAAPLAPGQKLATQPPHGLHKLGLSAGRKDGVLYVPSSYRHSSPTPLVLTLHGAGGNGISKLSVVASLDLQCWAGRELCELLLWRLLAKVVHMLPAAVHHLTANLADGQSHMTDLAERHGLILVSPDSKGSTWDFLRDGFGPDVAYIDAALQHVFGQVELRLVCQLAALWFYGFILSLFRNFLVVMPVIFSAPNVGHCSLAEPRLLGFGKLQCRLGAVAAVIAWSDPYPTLAAV